MRRYIVLALMMMFFTACFKQKPKVIVIEADENPVPGTVQSVYVEEHRDVVVVPGQVDETNTYYRAPHKTVYEVRPGRVQPVQYPEEDKDEPSELRGQ